MDLLQAVLHGLTTAFTFLLVITVLIAVHELGHYWFAKLCGMHVNAFAVMVGGVRKTPLSQHLKKPLTNAMYLWIAGIAISVITLLAGFFGNKIVFFAGLTFMATIGPAWVISRLSALYHRNFSIGLLTMAKSWGVVLLILGVGTRFQNVDFVYAISMLVAASACAVFIVYYAPVIGAHDAEANSGQGEIQVDHEIIPVRFRPLAHFTNKEGTEFSLLLLPLGGFASIKGMQPQEDGSETQIPQGFFSKSPVKRLLVLFAGPLFSILLGVVLLFVGFLGQGEAIQTNVIDKVTSDAASKGILEPGDKIIAVNNERTTEFFDIQKLVRFSYTEVDGEVIPTPLNVTVDRKGETKSFVITPKISEKKSKYPISDTEVSEDERFQALLGVMSKQEFKPISVQKAASVAIQSPLIGVQRLFGVFTNYETAKESVGGPGTMVEQTSNAVANGIWQVLFLAGGLSLSLGLLNLLPFPPLDGGQMVIAFIELLRGNKRLSITTQSALHNVGGMLVLLLMLAAFTIDASRRSEANKPEEKPKVEKPAVKKPDTEEKKTD